MNDEEKTSLGRRLEELLHKQLVKGDTWYLVDMTWFKQLRVFLDLDPSGDPAAAPSHPGPIDNGPLFSQDGSHEIRPHMIDDVDFRLVPTEAWTRLVNNFGLAGEEGRRRRLRNVSVVARKVIEQGMFVKHCKVEVYLVELHLAKSNGSEVKKANFSKSDTIGHIVNEMRRLFSIPDDAEIRLWKKYTPDNYEQLTNLENTVQDAGLYGGQLLVIETRNADGTWSMGEEARRPRGTTFASGQERKRDMTDDSDVVSKKRYKEQTVAYVNEKRQLEKQLRSSLDLQWTIDGKMFQAKLADEEMKRVKTKKEKLLGEVSALKRLPDYRSESQVKEIMDKLDEINSLVAAVKEMTSEDDDHDKKDCPVCFERAAEVFSCMECENWMCQTCRPKMAACPSCRQDFVARPPRRNRGIERALGI